MKRPTGKRTMLQTLAARLKQSVTKVDPKAKKRFRASLKARGVSKTQIRRAETRAAAAEKAAARAVKEPEKEKTGVEKLRTLASIGLPTRKIQK